MHTESGSQNGVRLGAGTYDGNVTWAQFDARFKSLIAVSDHVVTRVLDGYSYTLSVVELFSRPPSPLQFDRYDL